MARSIVSWIYVIARVFGFLPFSVEYNEKQKISKVHVTILDVFWFIFAIAIYAMVIVSSAVHHYAKASFSGIEILATILITIEGGLIAIISIVMDMFNRKRIFRIMIKLNEFDEEVF